MRNIVLLPLQLSALEQLSVLLLIQQDRTTKVNVIGFALEAATVVIGDFPYHICQHAPMPVPLTLCRPHFDIISPLPRELAPDWAWHGPGLLRKVPHCNAIGIRHHTYPVDLETWVLAMAEVCNDLDLDAWRVGEEHGCPRAKSVRMSHEIRSFDFGFA